VSSPLDRRKFNRFTVYLIRLHGRLVSLLQHYLTDKQFVTISGVLVGLSSALAAIGLKGMVFYLHHLLFTQGAESTVSPWIYCWIPLVGIVITSWIIHRYFDGSVGGGNGQIVYAIKRKRSRLPRRLMYSHVITSAITVGTGGSTGLETPIVTTGAAIGSNYGRTYKVKESDRTILLAAGVAAGISATFNAPIAGVLFAIEVLLSELAIASFIPILIASASGAILSKIILNEDILLNFTSMAEFDYHNVPFYIVLGIMAGGVSAYYIKTYVFTESLFSRIKKQYRIQKAIIGGFLLGLLILAFPPLFGEGYESIKMLARDEADILMQQSMIFHGVSDPVILLLLLTAIMFLKVFATAITIGSGGNGGNFAPSLFCGAYLGYTFSSLLNTTGFIQLPVANFTVVAMGGILSGIFYAPLTAIFLIAEITGGYDLIIPLMIVSALSFGTSRYLHGYSLDGLRLQKMLEKKAN